MLYSLRRSHTWNRQILTKYEKCLSLTGVCIIITKWVYYNLLNKNVYKETCREDTKEMEYECIRTVMETHREAIGRERMWRK